MNHIKNVTIIMRMYCVTFRLREKYEEKLNEKNEEKQENDVEIKQNGDKKVKRT
jgi:hypothetical protein